MNQYQKTQLLEDNKEEILFALDNHLETKASLAKKYGVHRSTIHRALKRWESEYYLPYTRTGKMPYLFTEDDDETDYWLGYLTQRGSLNLFKREGEYIRRKESVRLTVTGPKVEEFAAFCENRNKVVNGTYQQVLNRDEADYLAGYGLDGRRYRFIPNLAFLKGIYDATEERGVIKFPAFSWTGFYHRNVLRLLTALAIEYNTDWHREIRLDPEFMDNITIKPGAALWDYIEMPEETENVQINLGTFTVAELQEAALSVADDSDD